VLAQKGDFNFRIVIFRKVSGAVEAKLCGI